MKPDEHHGSVHNPRQSFGPVEIGELLRRLPVGPGAIAIIAPEASALRQALLTRESNRPIHSIDPNTARRGIDAGQQSTISCDHVILADTRTIASMLEILQEHQLSLTDNCHLWAWIDNQQHYSNIVGALTGDRSVPFEDMQLSDWPSAFKRFLDAGFLPRIESDLIDSCPHPLLQSLATTLTMLHLHPMRMQRYLSARRFLIHGVREAKPPTAPREPLFVVSCATDDAVIAANLARSPDLSTAAEALLAFHNCTSAAQAANAVLDRHPKHWVVLCHQDVYLPRGWFERMLFGAWQAVNEFGPVGVVGAYGITMSNGTPTRAGRVIDRDRPLVESTPLPCCAISLDEVVLAFPPGCPIRLDESLGFHLYGTDVALKAERAGKKAIVVDAPCFHNSRSVTLPNNFAISVQTFAEKWRSSLPIWTSCVAIHGDGTFGPWGRNE